MAEIEPSEREQSAQESVQESVQESAQESAQAKADREMMARAIALAKESGKAREYPYGVVICRGPTVVASSINRVKHDRDVTRHAEVVAISDAQKTLRTISLDDCAIYVSAEPCAFCCYAIRESRIARVVYGLHSPHMGGVSKWNVLTDEDISRTMPEVFAPPPEILGGFMAQEAAQALLEWNPLVWTVMRKRGLFVVEAAETAREREQRLAGKRPSERLMSFLRRAVFDRFGRR
jgi:tRNA(adenine34) deaminase